MATLIDASFVKDKHEGMNAGLSMFFGIGIGTILGMVIASCLAPRIQNDEAKNMLQNEKDTMADSPKIMQSKFHRASSPKKFIDLRKKSYEFGLEYGISPGQSGSDWADSNENISVGYGQNYGVSGFGSGYTDSQTNMNRKNEGGSKPIDAKEIGENIGMSESSYSDTLAENENYENSKTNYRD